MSEEIKQDDLIALVKSLQDEIKQLKAPKVKARPKAKKKKYKPRKKKIVVDNEEEVPTTPDFLPNRTPGRARFTQNKFVDDGSLCQGDKEHNKKYGDKYRVEPRIGKAPVQMIEVKCEHCPSRATVPSTQLQKLPGSNNYYYICGSCARKGIR